MLMFEQFSCRGEMMFETIKKNLLRIQEDIAPCKPRIIAVTKYFSKEAMIAAYEAGLRDFGESRVIEASEKINSLPDEVRKNSTFHLIGHLQTNKVKQAVKNFDLFKSIMPTRSKSSVFQKMKCLKLLDKLRNLIRLRLSE